MHMQTEKPGIFTIDEACQIHCSFLLFIVLLSLWCPWHLTVTTAIITIPYSILIDRFLLNPESSSAPVLVFSTTTLFLLAYSSMIRLAWTLSSSLTLEVLLCRRLVDSSVPGPAQMLEDSSVPGCLLSLNAQGPLIFRNSKNFVINVSRCDFLYIYLSVMSAQQWAFSLPNKSLTSSLDAKLKSICMVMVKLWILISILSSLFLSLLFCMLYVAAYYTILIEYLIKILLNCGSPVVDPSSPLTYCSLLSSIFFLNRL